MQPDPTQLPPYFFQNHGRILSRWGRTRAQDVRMVVDTYEPIPKPGKNARKKQEKRAKLQQRTDEIGQAIDEALAADDARRKAKAEKFAKLAASHFATMCEEYDLVPRSREVTIDPDFIEWVKCQDKPPPRPPASLPSPPEALELLFAKCMSRWKDYKGNWLVSPYADWDERGSMRMQCPLGEDKRIAQIKTRLECATGKSLWWQEDILDVNVGWYLGDKPFGY